MSGAFPNRPRILRGAFVEYGLSIPPLITPFQYNPEQIKRSRSIQYSAPGRSGQARTLRDFHKNFASLSSIRDMQHASIAEETIDLELRFDASDQMEEGEFTSVLFGVEPRLAALELMMLPKSESSFSRVFNFLRARGYSFTNVEKPPMVLLIWGVRRIVPVNINSITVTEILHNTHLAVMRASVAVNLTVIEGRNPLARLNRFGTEALATVNLLNVAEYFANTATYATGGSEVNVPI